MNFANKLKHSLFKIDKLIWIAFSLSVILFWTFPQIDRYAAGLFYDGSSFYLSQNEFVLFLHRYTQVFTVVIGAILLGLLLLALTTKKTIFFQKKALAFLIITLIIGPGLVVNSVFKDNFGRARPAQIKEFGGQKEFTRAFEISSNCQRNCSFTCGHAAVAFWYLSFGFIVNRNWKYKIFMAGTFFGLIVGFGRMAQGGHFLSDVIFSYFFVYLVSKITYEVLYPDDIN